jgi:hypothetical protein
MRIAAISHRNLSNSSDSEISLCPANHGLVVAMAKTSRRMVALNESLIPRPALVVSSSSKMALMTWAIPRNFAVSTKPSLRNRLVTTIIHIEIHMDVLAGAW